MKKALTVSKILILILLSCQTTPPKLQKSIAVFSYPEQIKEFAYISDLLSAFWDKPVLHKALVILPPHYHSHNHYALCYHIHGFGNSYREGLKRGVSIMGLMEKKEYPAMIYIFLNANFTFGHHEFADSANNGPWAKALIHEFIPALEAQYAPFTTAQDRFLTGHSSGGWSALWLQITYPDFFNGCWATAPDSVDFRDFSSINIYKDKNAYFDETHQERQLVRKNGNWIMSLKEFVDKERQLHEHYGQFFSFNAVFSPKGKDGLPLPLFDWKTGIINKEVAHYWQNYDITKILVNNWIELGPRLSGKLHIYMGAEDTYRLEGAVVLLKQELDRLVSDAQIIIVPDRDHSNLSNKHETLWPEGMLARIYKEIEARFLFFNNLE